MNTIKFNNTTFPVESFNKNTYLSPDGTVMRDGNCVIMNTNTDGLIALMHETITAIYIYHNETLIYDSEDISVHISNINETLIEDHVSISLILRFDNE